MCPSFFIMPWNLTMRMYGGESAIKDYLISELLGKSELQLWPNLSRQQCHWIDIEFHSFSYRVGFPSSEEGWDLYSTGKTEEGSENSRTQLCLNPRHLASAMSTLTTDPYDGLSTLSHTVGAATKLPIRAHLDITALRFYPDMVVHPCQPARPVIGLANFMLLMLLYFFWSIVTLGPIIHSLSSPLTTSAALAHQSTPHFYSHLKIALQLWQTLSQVNIIIAPWWCTNQ